MNFSIYADDVTLSSDKFIPKAFAEGIFKQGFVKFDLEETFKLNNKKSIGKSKNRRKVTGVSFNPTGKCTIRRPYYACLRASLDHLRKGTYQYSIQRLSGQLAFATMIDETEKTKNLCSKYLPEIQKWKLLGNEKLKSMGVI